VAFHLREFLSAEERQLLITFLPLAEESVLARLNRPPKRTSRRHV
jgi:hypothetical protein